MSLSKGFSLPKMVVGCVIRHRPLLAPTQSKARHQLSSLAALPAASWRPGHHPNSHIMSIMCSFSCRFPPFVQHQYAAAGLGMTLGMHWIHVPGATGSYDSSFHHKAEAICAALTGCPAHNTTTAPLPPTCDAGGADGGEVAAPASASSPSAAAGVHAAGCGRSGAEADRSWKPAGALGAGVAPELAGDCGSAAAAEPVQSAAAGPVDSAGRIGVRHSHEAPPDGAAAQRRGFDFGFVHVKAVDDCGHDRLWQLRVRYLEAMDGLVAQIVRRLHEAERVRATSMHAVPLTRGGRSGARSHPSMLCCGSAVVSMQCAAGLARAARPSLCAVCIAVSCPSPRRTLLLRCVCFGCVRTRRHYASMLLHNACASLVVRTYAVLHMDA